MKKLLFISLVLVSFYACVDKKKDATPSNDNNSANRSLILTNYADEIVMPGYDIFKKYIDTLDVCIDTFSLNTNKDNLLKLRTSWENAYLEWQKVELFEFGPASDYATRNFFNLYPANVSGIKTNIINGNANLEISSNYTSQGFPAFDYLINGVASTDDSIVSVYKTDINAQKNKDYLKKLSNQMKSKLNEVILGWQTYRSDFINKTNMTASGSLSLVVNGYVHNYERFIRSGKFGIPAGAITQITAPEKVEAFYKKDISGKLALAAHQASIDFFNGKSRKTGSEGKSLKTYLDDLNAMDALKTTKLSSVINQQFTVVNNSISAMNSNFNNLVINDNQKMLDTYNEFQKQVKLLKVDMTSALSITITYTDTDGD